ncbi:MAG: hypothetical protein ACR2FI_03785 [Burkholderiales bacterium]
MYEAMTAASNSYLDMTWQVAGLCWGSSQRLTNLQAEAGVRLFAESADRMKNTLSKRNGDQSLKEWNALYLNNATKVYDMTCQSLDEVKKVGAEIAQVIDDYAETVTQQARQATDDLSANARDKEKGSEKTRKSA